ncbi:hypothetical protein BDZ45DRAFT_430535 [Acephala macrosclerotiorum]|nr:hypothetical protein BDZ45DRAFT_430535 [Acephala macrosclerotiorum]
MAHRAYTIRTSRLDLRTLQSSDLPAYELLYNDSENRKFGAIPYKYYANQEQLGLGVEKAREKGAIELLVILKNDYKEQVQIELELSDQAFDPLKVEGGTAIGVVFIEVLEHDDRSSNVGGFIHYWFARKGFAHEAFHYVFNFAFDTTIHGAGRESLCLETQQANTPFRNLMRKMNLGELEQAGPVREDTGEANVVYTLNKAYWDWAKQGSKFV